MATMTEEEKKKEEKEDVVEMDASFSPQFVREVNNIKALIRRLVEDNETRNYFGNLTSNMADNTGLLRIQFNKLMSKMEEAEKRSIVKELIKMNHHIAEKNPPDRVYVGTNYERVVDRLLRFAHEHDVISTTLCAEGLIMTTDFRLCSRICQEKWKFIKECIPKIDYKGIRNILRYILESQLRRLPFALAPEQVNELRIVEDVVLQIVDRDSNLMPPLITLSEVMRGMPKQAQMLPRLTEKLGSLSVYFRPIADLTHVCGRSFIYPIPMHPCLFPPTSFWDDFGNTGQNSLQQQHHTLPYRPEHTTTFLYTQYMILRQPFGKDSFNQQRNPKPKSHWDILISVMICESMAEAETLPENEPIPRYQWDNIVNMVNFGVAHHLLNPKNFFAVLNGLVKSTKYTRARDEVMWIVFQVVGSLFNITRLDDALQEIVQLYRDLFDGDVVWMGASDHPALFARFLAAASTWMILEKEFGEKMPEANATIKSHIKFIQDGAENFDKSNIAMLAVLANAYRPETKYGKQIPPVITQMLDETDESQPRFQLSYNRTAANSFSAFPVEFLDALTLRSKKLVLTHCLNCMRSFTAEKLPSPAVFEVMARICHSEDFEMAVKEVDNLAQRSLYVTNTSPDSMPKDQCFFVFDFLCYRLSHLHAYSKFSHIIQVLGHFTHHIQSTPQNHQIYRLMEQYLMRRWCWTGFHECIGNYISLVGPSKDSSLNRYLANPKSFCAPMDGIMFPINPEVFKMSIYSFLRAVKITGQEVALEEALYPTLIAGWGWPKKSTSYFPKWALDVIAMSNPAKHLPKFDEILRTVREASRLHPSLTPHQFVLKFGEDPNILTNHCILATLFKLAYDSLDTKPDCTSEFYEILAKKTPKDIVVMGNYLVDYIIADTKSQDCNEQTYKNIAKAASILIFQYQVMRADRFLLSLTMHPSTDEDAMICMQVANEFILTPEFQERIKWFHANVPKKEVNPTEYIKMIVKYHDQYPEFEIFELVRSNDSSSNPHLPNYYGCLIERLLPILDQFVSMTLEQQGYKFNPQVLQTLAMFYKYHAMPIHFIYSVLHITHGSLMGPEAKSFVTLFSHEIEDVHLTEQFEKFNHQKASKEQLIMELIDRMTGSLDFILTPPVWVAKDWKTAEMSPGAQTLYLACIEIMASPHPPEALVPAMINVMQMKPHLRPYNVVNLIALMLTALPSAYAAALNDEFIAVFENGDVEKLKFEDIVFDNYEEYQLMNLTNRARSVNVILQAYWTHVNLCLVNSSFAQEMVPKLLKHVKTGKELWYLLRFVMPILRRYWENWDLTKQMRKLREKFAPLTIIQSIFEKLGSMAEEGVELVYEKHLCDLFYNCKYVFVGDFLRDTATIEFTKLPEKMRDRLKFYVSQEPVRAPTPEEETPEKETAPQQPEVAKQQATRHPEQQRQYEMEAAHQQQQAMLLHQQQQQQHHQMMQHQQHQAHQNHPAHSQEAHHPQHHPQLIHQMEMQQQQHHQAQQHAAQQAHQQHPMHMTPQYPGMSMQQMHHQQQQMHQMQMQMQYGMHQQQMTPHHPMPGQMQGQMHPMMHNMTQQQQYAYMQQMQMQQMQQQQQQGQYMHHHHHPHMQ